jgi:hypothetical protein
VFLSNLIWWPHHSGTKVQLCGLEKYSAPLHFLDDSLFFEQHCGSKIKPEASPRLTTRPLAKIARLAQHFNQKGGTPRRFWKIGANPSAWSPTPEEAPSFGLLILSAKPADASAPAGRWG